MREHIHDDLDERDLEFLKKFEEISKKDQDDWKDRLDERDEMTDEMKEGLLDAPEHGQIDSHHEVDEFMVETDIEIGGGDHNSEGQGDAEGQGQGEGEGQGEGQGEGDGDGENTGEQDDGESEGDQCDGNCDEADDQDKSDDPCPYCTEKKKRQQQQRDKDNEGESEPIAFDADGAPIFVGTEIISDADGSGVRGDEFEYTGVVMGVAEGYEFDEIQERRIVIFRRDLEMGGYKVSGEPDWGWGVDSNLTFVVEEEKEKKEDEQDKHNHEEDHHDQREDDMEDDGDRPQMTKTQRERFDNICKRIFPKAQATFGTTIEGEPLIGADAPGGIFDNEEVSRTMDIESRGITYRVTISAERNIT